jgi:heme exporter protein A|tara:strand:- start:453 stop:1061 length:609 start_codon:yes stop_codon:yes gene_type:complete
VTDALTLQFDSLACQRDGRALFAELNLTAPAGTCVELLGANGAGKSTLLRTLAGLHSQYQGTFQSPPAVYQGHRLGLDELLTPLENLAWFAGLESCVFDQTKALALAARLGILALAHTPCGKLSAGQQRRVAMIRWVLSGRRLWLLDEPLTALDTHAQAWLNEIIAEHCQSGGSVVCATHTDLSVPLKTVLNLRPPPEQASW